VPSVLLGRGEQEFESIPLAPIAVYTYCDSLATSPGQLLFGERKVAPDFTAKNDLASPTREAGDVSGIHYVIKGDVAQGKRSWAREGKYESRFALILACPFTVNCLSQGCWHYPNGGQEPSR